MPISSIKMQKARNLCRLLPMAHREIENTINKIDGLESLTSKQLALVMAALNVHWHKSAKQTEKNIVSDGYVWNEEKQILITFDN